MNPGIVSTSIRFANGFALVAGEPRDIGNAKAATRIGLARGDLDTIGKVRRFYE